MMLLEHYGSYLTSAIIQVADHMKHSKLTEDVLRDVAEANGVDVGELGEAVLETFGTVKR